MVAQQPQSQPHPAEPQGAKATLEPALAFEAYRSRAGINQSGLTAVLRSPFYYQWQRDNPVKETLDMYLGRASHLCVLEPEQFDKAVEVVEIPSTGAKRATMLAAAGDSLLLSSSQFDLMRAQRDAVFANATAAEILANGAAEQSIFWHEDDFKVDAKARLDFMGSYRGAPVVVDLKTTQDLEADNWSRAVYNRRYDLQVCHYLRAANALQPDANRSFAFICVNKAPPYACVVYWAGPSVLEHGQAWWTLAMEEYALAYHTNEWRDIEQESVVQMPRWAKLPGERGWDDGNGEAQTD